MFLKLFLQSHSYRRPFPQLYLTKNHIGYVRVLITSGQLATGTGGKASSAHSGLQASEACRGAGGTRVGQKEEGFMEQTIRLQGAMISYKMALKDSTYKITRERQMDGMSNNQEEVCKIASLRHSVCNSP